MSTLTDRIAQFENMTAADPENEMAHFSLGNAYMQGGRASDAATSYGRCLNINPEMSKAYQLAGDAFIQSGQSEKAAEILTMGYEIAATRGDLMPKNAIAKLLESIGQPVPGLGEEAQKQADLAATSGNFICGRTGRAGTQLESPPFKGRVGAWIQENIASETWHAWIGQGTKVINEMRLDFSREEDQNAYDEHMYEFLGIDQALRETLGVG